MKYLHHRTDRGVVPALLLDGVVHDLDGVVPAVTGRFLASGDHAALLAAARKGDLPQRPFADVALESPIAMPSKIVCIGLNYRDHAEETRAAIPEEPVVFMKDPGTIVPADATVLVPRGSTKTDWEVELGVVIGSEARYLESPDEAAAVIGGYVLSHDVSEREFQLERGGQWDKGKSCDTFNPLGPYVVTADEVADPQALGLRLWVNDELKQDGTTADMIFSVLHVVQYLSRFMVLRPGDLINTGTPAGVALGQPDPKPYLRAGDVVTLEIDGLGRATQTVAQA
ncbi:MAG TPA: fumarylacetoacetate hydrolase family protein [Amnibacterium sp.]|jgi:2-keto-4-pentenoate hydratase/2-oxohepta-3-ene-1,7-dioic acid hydratase in catechol pathway|nr:fumarylacetoacetate hydrolase family protein [Amnibacterium sp.]